MWATVALASLLLSAPAEASPENIRSGCIPLGLFIKIVTESGYDFVATGIDNDGDKNVILYQPQTQEWLVAFFPTNSALACTLNRGTLFRVTPSGRS
jgi:hypothetical protein